MREADIPSEFELLSLLLEKVDVYKGIRGQVLSKEMDSFENSHIIIFYKIVVMKECLENEGVILN